MKKPVLTVVSILLSIISFAQDIPVNRALELVSNNLAAAGIPGNDIKNILVSSAYHDNISGADMVYIQQQFKNLPVYNKIKTLAFKNDVLVSASGSMIASIEKRIQNTTANPSIAPETAVSTAMTKKNISLINLPASKPTKNSNSRDFGKLDVARENVTAELIWVPQNDGETVKLAWQVYLVPATTSDYWLIRIDAETNTVLEETNLTVYCNFDHDHNEDVFSTGKKTRIKNTTAKDNQLTFSPSIVNNATYRVIPYPAESPIHPGGAPAVRSNPWSLAPGNATSLQWHNDGSFDYDYTRGNNVWAREDRDGINNTIGLPATSTTSPDPLTFDFVPDFAVTPTQTTPVPNQQFNITNLFYWNNLIHDLTYQYGFTEVAGNFQNNNQGRGGLGNDYVIAEAQDGVGTNNANFATPQDGGNGRMQMYLWNGSPQKDGDADNGIIVHEFGHGISTRLTGGPAQAGCLGNQEQMGEGWSDYFALMATQNWATTAVTDGFNSPRGLGTYATGSVVTGTGIRPRKYTTNMAVNEMTYANLPSQAVPHGVGFIWCTMLWDMTWEIIQSTGINPNLFDASGTGGNTIAMKLVMEGMKLQPCNPGMVDGRDAILKADQLLYGGLYRCAIMKAFARRGLGFDASQGSSTSSSDGTAGFSTVESNLTLFQNLVQQEEGKNVTYTNRVAAGPCSVITDYLITDTLPANVTYISGGNYNAGTRVVSFPVNLAAGETKDYSFTVQINSGSWFATTNLIDEKVAAGAMPSGWATSSVNSNNFIVSGAQFHSSPFAFFGLNAPAITDFKLSTTSSYALGANPPTFSFWHQYNTEDGWDGGLVEISTNNGTTWSDLGAHMTENGYNGGMGVGSNNPLGGREAFTGNSHGFLKTTISLLSFANTNAMFRFRMGSDDNTSEDGWYIDDILLQSRAMVNIRSSLFNASNNRIAVKDTFTTILQNTICVPAAISLQPANVNACAGANASFSAGISGSNLVSYQWQESTNGGSSYTNIAGATSSSYTLASVSLAQSGYLYRAVINDSCTINLLTLPATLNVNPPIIITQQPAGKVSCEGTAVAFTAVASGTALSYQWQVSTAGGSFTNLANDAVYTGANTATLNLSATTLAMNGNNYRVLITGSACGAATSAPASLTVNSLPQLNLTTTGLNSLTPYLNANIMASVSPAGNYIYQWFKDGILISTATTANLPVNVDALGKYKVTVTSSQGCSANSADLIFKDSASTQLFIYPNPSAGTFQVRYYNAGQSNTTRRINVYSSKGERVFTKYYPINASYSRMDVDLGNISGGIYLVELLTSKGERIATARVLVK